MFDKNIKVLTAKGGSQAINLTLYDYICLTSDRKLYYNESYANHPQVLNKIAYFKEAKLFDGKPIPLKSPEMRAFYDIGQKSVNESSQLQREITDLFALAVSKGASDVHIIVRKNECLIKIRTIGDLDLNYEYTAAHGNAICKTIFMTMCDQAGKNFQPKTRQDARMKAAYLPDGITGVRIGTSPTDNNGYIMVCRLLAKSDQNKMNLTRLGYEPFQLELINLAKSKKGGVNIFAGPTGSGKSTSMAIIIGDIISESNGTKHVITAENPVEYEIGGQISVFKEIDGTVSERKVMAYATQTPVMASTSKRTKEVFSDAIKAMMRLDPDVIMIGEIRDAGSLKATIDASMTGHQVWASVHATTAMGIIKRLITVSGDSEVSVEKDLICDSSIVSTLISQRLVKKLCPSCSELLIDKISNIDKSLVQRLKSIFAEEQLRNIRVIGKGCNRCEMRGLLGRTVIAEIINCDQKFMELIAVSNYQAEQHWLSKLKGMPMMAHGLLKVYHGKIDPRDLEDELEYISLPEGFNKNYFNALLTA